MTHNHNLIEAKIATKATQEKQRIKRNYNSWFISKWTIKHIVSFFLTPRATAHNNNNVLAFAIFEYKMAFLEEFDHAYNACNAILAQSQTLY